MKKTLMRNLSIEAPNESLDCKLIRDNGVFDADKEFWFRKSAPRASERQVQPIHNGTTQKTEAPVALVAPASALQATAAGDAADKDEAKPDTAAKRMGLGQSHCPT